jgi:hypothetical protein
MRSKVGPSTGCSTDRTIRDSTCGPFTTSAGEVYHAESLERMRHMAARRCAAQCLVCGGTQRNRAAPAPGDPHAIRWTSRPALVVAEGRLARTFVARLRSGRRDPTRARRRSTPRTTASMHTHRRAREKGGKRSTRAGSHGPRTTPPALCWMIGCGNGTCCGRSRAYWPDAELLGAIPQRTASLRGRATDCVIWTGTAAISHGLMRIW